MAKVSAATMISILEQIDLGSRNYTTLDARYGPLWQHPFLRESLARVLNAYDSGDPTWHEDLRNFQIVCDYMAPQFASILEQIDLPITSIPSRWRRVDRVAQHTM